MQHYEEFRSAIGVFRLIDSEMNVYDRFFHPFHSLVTPMSSILTRQLQSPIEGLNHYRTFRIWTTSKVTLFPVEVISRLLSTFLGGCEAYHYTNHGQSRSPRPVAPSERHV